MQLRVTSGILNSSANFGQGSGEFGCKQKNKNGGTDHRGGLTFDVFFAKYDFISKFIVKSNKRIDPNNVRADTKVSTK